MRIRGRVRVARRRRRGSSSELRTCERNGNLHARPHQHPRNQTVTAKGTETGCTPVAKTGGSGMLTATIKVANGSCAKLGQASRWSSTDRPLVTPGAMSRDQPGGSGLRSAPHPVRGTASRPAITGPPITHTPTSCPDTAPAGMIRCRDRKGKRSRAGGAGIVAEAGRHALVPIVHRHSRGPRARDRTVGRRRADTSGRRRGQRHVGRAVQPRRHRVGQHHLGDRPRSVHAHRERARSAGLLPGDQQRMRVHLVAVGPRGHGVLTEPR